MNSETSTQVTYYDERVAYDVIVLFIVDNNQFCHIFCKIMETQLITQYSNTEKLIAPSVLAADFSRLGAEIERAEEGGCDIMHLDVMDGHFVPNLSIGPPVVEKVRKCTNLPFDVHLMLDEPENFAVPFAEAGANNITVHAELGDKIHSVLETIRNNRCTAGLCIKPATPAEAVTPFLENVDMILVMTVEPGFGGQEFDEQMLPKIKTVREIIDACDHQIHLEVDGGINCETASLAGNAGANVFVAGTTVFKNQGDLTQPITDLRQAAVNQQTTTP